MKRRLWFGLALLLAMASVYAGLLGFASWLQWTLAAAAIVTAIVGSRTPEESVTSSSDREKSS